MEQDTKPDYYNDITIGADPEFFLTKNGNPISAHDIVPGTKDKPYPLKRGVAVQADGTAVEFNIPPAKTARDFSESLQDGLDQIRQLVPKDLEFNYSPSIRYPKNYFASLPKAATELGCSPDYQAHNYSRKSAPIDPKNIGSIRVAGGHIHIGWGSNLPIEPGHMFDCAIITRQVDNFFKSYEQLWDHDKIRKEFYGMRGAYRPKSYGVEYRGLSNAWLNYPKLWPWIFDNTKAIFEHTKVDNLGNIIPQSVYYNWSMTNEQLRLYLSRLVPFSPNLLK